MTTTKPTRQVLRALGRENQEQQTQRLTDQILNQAEIKAAATAAAALTQACLSDAELQAWRQDMEGRLQIIQQHPERNLGHIEEELARSVKEPLRLLAQRAAQVKANATPCHCRQCQGDLTQQKFLSRTIDSRFGPLALWRRYGWCSHCEQWQFPADHALGLGRQAPASPYLQEISALLVSKMPVEQVVGVAERLGLDLSRCFLHREAHRQGLKAQERRAQTVAELESWETIQQLNRYAEGPPLQPFTLVIEIDAWNIRERDNWGQTKALRQQRQELKRWHWVYLATVFRLEHRGQNQSQRAFITERGYVATRGGVDALTAQLHREAISRGLGQAEQVLVIADGALWIWNVVKDRFGEARQRLDLYHADEHLWAIANDLYGRGTPEARAWVTPLLQKIRDDQTPSLIATLGELKPSLLQAQQEKLQTQIDYFNNNAHRMKYKEIITAREACEAGTATEEQRKLANQPLGSGAVESACRQYQCRFKRTGQFWTTAGDEALLCLETFWRNGRWQELYPHASPASLLN
ncbi:MAG: hypothetical protein O2960_13300 [Verrucomicrobia bacterium]|nr:hypothetical protein [Verrucomicrobiota bacterium]